MTSVDVVVPCYNYARFLQECVGSVLSQDGVDVRVLIIDDASIDDTTQVGERLASLDRRVSFRRHPKNVGHIATYNEGLEWASADYLLLLSADDYLLPDALGRATRLMDAHPEVGLTFGNVVELRDGGHETRTKNVIGETRILVGREFIALSGAENLVATCSAVVRTELQKRVGGYRSELPHAGDMEMWLRFGAHAPVGFISEWQGVYRQHKQNMSTAYYEISSGDVVYTSTGRLADLQQRKAALDCFSQHCRDCVPQFNELAHTLHHRLADLAVQRASAAFNEGEMEACGQLRHFALAVCPDISRSARWARLAVKRWMGARMWRILSLAAATIHGAGRHREVWLRP